MFEDRKDAGKKLAKALEKYKNKGVLVLAIPRGGVEVGYQIAKYLNADFSILISTIFNFFLTFTICVLYNYLSRLALTVVYDLNPLCS